MFEIASIIIVLAGLFSFANVKYLRLPTTVGVMLIALLASLALVLAGNLGLNLRQYAASMVGGIDFDRILLHGMLAFLLFAGAFKLDMADLRPQWLVVSLLALLGTAISMLLIGGGLYSILRLLHLPVPMIHCLLFGALIFPTDPVAVLGIMKTAGARKSLETQMAGEALFNDGVAVVAFLSLLALAGGQSAPSVGATLILLAREAGGAIALGLAAGYATYQLVKRVDDYQVEALLTLGLAMGGYTLAERLNVSAPICVVVAGLLLGNRGRAFGMSPRTQQHLGVFWELIDMILNVVLFMLLGLEVLVVPFRSIFLLVGLVAIAISLFARWLSVAGIIGGLSKLGRPFGPGTVLELVWGGLRGGISLAMALSLPAVNHREVLIAATYCVVVFSILVQGLTIAPLVRRNASDKPHPDLPVD